MGAATKININKSCIEINELKLLSNRVQAININKSCIEMMKFDCTDC